MVGLLWLGGCPGSIDDPAVFCLSDVCSPTRVRCVIEQTCATAGCHNVNDVAGDLDLETDSGDVNALRLRLTTLQSVAGDCAGAPMIDVGDPARSYLLAKLRGDPGICGIMMPQQASLAASDIECLSEWVAGDVVAPDSVAASTTDAEGRP